MLRFFKKKSSPICEEKTPQKEEYDDAEALGEYFYNETGITFEKQKSILKSKLSSFSKQRNIYSFESLLQSLQTQESLKQELIDYLTTNETFFYREIRQVQELVTLVAQTKSSVRILCAPSATGEEPYSIAIALLEAGVSPSLFEIVGIDINSQAIQKAQEALYRERNIRNLPPELISKYFEEDDTIYLLKQNVKSLVTFKMINIFDSAFESLGKFDFVFSRNMLIYFDKETKQRAKNILQSMRKNEKYEVFFGHADLF